MEQQHFESLYPDTVRDKEIGQIAHYIKEGSSCQLLGLPGVSRSTLLGLLVYNKALRKKHFGTNAENTHFVMVNFSEIRKRPLVDAMKFLFLNLADSLRERKLDEEFLAINALFKESLSFGDELVLFQALKQAVSYLAQEKKLTIVFLFDRFEEYIPTVTPEFFINLRTLRNKAKYQFSIVFSLNRPLEDVVDPTTLADFYEFVAGHHVYLQLSDQPTTDFRISYIESLAGKKLSDKTKKTVLELTGGHGKLTKLAVENLLAHGEDQPNIQDFLLARRSIKGALNEIWLALSPAEQSDLLEGKFTDPQVLQYLEEVGLVREGKIQIPLFTHYISTEFTHATVAPGKIVYDPNTHTIRRGEVVVSDQLTSSEYRLLSYLLQNQDRIVDREELISVVWQGMKSTAGITDQAVDQLVFRVRRKIEEDANNPVHLLTVKGRGFKFAA